MEGRADGWGEEGSNNQEGAGEAVDDGSCGAEEVETCVFLPESAVWVDEAEVEEPRGDEETYYDDNAVGVKRNEDGVGDCGDGAGGGADEDHGEDPVEEEGRGG